MRHRLRYLRGVTLLEIMLVLSIIALIILMSIRYYQAVSNASQIEQAAEAIESITAAADSLAMGSIGGYSMVTPSNVTSLSGPSALTSPWGTPINIQNQTATTYGVSMDSAPNAVCQGLADKLESDPKYTNFTCGGSGGSGMLSYTYDTTATTTASSPPSSPPTQPCGAGMQLQVATPMTNQKQNSPSGLSSGPC